ncbi:MAG TPA: diphthine--ammonia ligase [Gemmatimonadales bacterium]|jgi:uncharacterized protein (TIGR00290 family)|nr:diphthine--ammonia ligase [Gemmatimonadales bacterium]
MPVFVAWSGGKDSTLALEAVLRDDREAVATLLTTVTAGYERISMHGVRRALLARQAAALGLSLAEVRISPQASNAEYEANMSATLTTLRAQHPGVDSVVFGDLFLEEIRAYRERMLGHVGMRGLFPLWHRDTTRLAHEFVGRGYQAILACVDATALPAAFAGREFDRALLADLPSGVDPCGENGEFHTFVYAGPIFATPIPVCRGEIVVRDGRFVYCDLLEPAA